MAANVSLLTSYILLAVFVLNVKCGSIRRKTVSEEAGCSSLLSSCFEGYENYDHNKYTTVDAFAASKTLAEHCRLIKEMTSCVDNFLQDTTNQCESMKLYLQNNLKFQKFSSATRNTYKHVCETGFSKFNAAYECLFYQSNLQQLKNLSKLCMTDSNSGNEDKTFCDHLNDARVCLKSASTEMCGQEIGEIGDEAVQLYFNFQEKTGEIPSCLNPSKRRSFGDLLTKLMSK